MQQPFLFFFVATSSFFDSWMFSSASHAFSRSGVLGLFSGRPSRISLFFLPILAGKQFLSPREPAFFSVAGSPALSEYW